MNGTCTGGTGTPEGGGVLVRIASSELDQEVEGRDWCGRFFGRRIGTRRERVGNGVETGKREGGRSCHLQLTMYLMK